MLNRILHKTALFYLKELNDEIKLTNSKLARYQTTKQYKKLKALFGALKTFNEIEKEKSRAAGKLAQMFSEVHLQMYSKNKLRRWANFTFNNENSTFHKMIKAKDHHRLRLKKKVIHRIMSEKNNRKKISASIISLEKFIRLKNIRKPFNKILVATIENQERNKIAELGRIFREWRQVVVSIMDERKLENLMKENEEQSMNNEDIEKRRMKNQRFINRLIPLRNLGVNNDRSQGIQNATEFSSEADPNSSDKEIKSAM